MKAVLFLCLLGVAVAQNVLPKYSWGGPDVDPSTENVCLTDQSSCGCCLMQKQMARMEEFFNMSLNELQKGMEKAQNALANIRASRSAFSLALTDQRVCIGPYRDVMPVHYNVVFLNMGDGYNIDTGMFTAPRSGVYSLSVTVYSDAGAPAASLSACVSLTVNGKQVASPSEMNQQDQEDSATAVLAVQLKAGDKVGVYLPIGCFLCDNDSHYNTFSGFLLYATD